MTVGRGKCNHSKKEIPQKEIPSKGITSIPVSSCKTIVQLSKYVTNAKNLPTRFALWRIGRLLRDLGDEAAW